MNSRERVQMALNHQEADRIPILDSPWAATVERWHKEGMPVVNPAEYFGYEIVRFEPDTSPRFPVQVVEENFHVQVPYYVRLRFDAVQSIVDALGGVTVQLKEDTGVLAAGTHHLDGTQALAFVRDRKGADDFFRMAQGQFILIQAARQLLNPLTWPRYPIIAATFLSVVDTNLPAWADSAAGPTPPLAEWPTPCGSSNPGGFGTRCGSASGSRWRWPRPASRGPRSSTRSPAAGRRGARSGRRVRRAARRRRPALRRCLSSRR